MELVLIVSLLIPHVLAHQQPISTRNLKEFAGICVYPTGRTT